MDDIVNKFVDLESDDDKITKLENQIEELKSQNDELWRKVHKNEMWTWLIMKHLEIDSGDI